MRGRALRTLGLAAGAVLAIAGCGGSSHRPAAVVHISPHVAVAPKAVAVPVKVVSSHVCDKNDYSMGCALPPVATPEVAGASLATTQQQGVDFAWSCPLSSARDFGASYLSTDTAKNWTRSCVDQFHAAHKATVAVWETSADRTLSGYSAGQADARAADAQIRALGGTGAHIDFAIDFDEQSSQAAAVASYFRGADSVLGVNRVGAYGGYWAVTRLCDAHLTTASWATYAWSGGRWPPASCAPLEQYLNSTSVDYDRAIAPYYGQWPYKTAAPRPTGPHCFSKHPDTKNATCKRVRHQVHVLWTELHYSVHRARTRGCVLLWVERHGTYHLAVSLKSGPLCTKIAHNASRERKTIDTTWARYK